MNPWEEYASAETGPWSEFEQTEEKAGNGLIGYGETALNLISQGVAQIPAGVSGLVNTAIHGPEAGMDAFNQVNDFLTYEPRSQKGQEFTKAAGEGLDKLLTKAGDIASAPMRAGSRLAHNAGLTSEEEFQRQQNLFDVGGRAGAELGLNFAPIPGASALHGVRGSLAKGRAKAVPKPSINLKALEEVPGPQSTLSKQVLAEIDRQLAEQNKAIASKQLDQSIAKGAEGMKDVMARAEQEKLFRDRAIEMQNQARREQVLHDLDRGEDPLYVTPKGEVAEGAQLMDAEAQRTANNAELSQLLPEEQAPWNDYKDIPNQATIDEPIARSVFDEENAMQKQQEVDAAYAQREAQLADESAFNEQATRDEGMQAGIEEPLRQGLRVPKSQLGAINIGEITGMDANHPAVMAARTALTQDKQRAVMSKSAGLDAYTSNINTPEKVIAAALDGAKDISSRKFLGVGYGQLERGKTVTPGVNAVAVSTNNPVVKYTREKIRGAHMTVENLARQYLTDKKTGLRSVYEKMTPQEIVNAHAILLEGDKAQRVFTREEMASMGASERVQEFVERLRAADDFKLQRWNERRAEVGKDPVRERPGHFPGVFRGDYKKLVYKTVDGKKQIAGIIAVDSTRQLRKVEEYIKQNMPELEVDKKFDRRSLGGNGNRTDIFSGMSDVIDVLSRNNPEFAQIQEMIRNGLREKTESLFGADKHALEKKGVFGSEGNKPWKNGLDNARDAFKAYFQYWEEGMFAHESMPVVDEMAALFQNPALDNMPNAKEYANQYLMNATGRNVGKVGDAFNKIMDAGVEVLGYGPSAARGIVNQVNKRAGQWAMGFGNLAFTGLQFTQVLQTALPEMMNVAKKAGISVADPLKGFAKTLGQLPDIWNAMRGKENGLSPIMKQAVVEAKERGINQFSEFQDINQMSQSVGSRLFDKVADANRSFPETWTRSFVFYSLVNMLDGHLPASQIFDVAYNATQSGMFDYALMERPQMYQKLGTVGQLAGSLQTFKHNFISQQARFAKEFAKGNVAPMLASIAGMATLSGIMGIPFYQELDELVKFITDKFFDEQQNIEQLALRNAPEWAKRGYLTSSSGLNFQSRLSAANVLPDSLPEAISPYAGMIGNIGGAAADVVDKRGSEQAIKNLGFALTPNSLRGIAEEKLKSRNGIPLDNQGRLGNPRSERDWTARKLGINTLDQAKLTEQQWVQTTRAMRDDAAKSSILTRAKFKLMEGSLDQAKLQDYVKQYVARGGDPNQFVNQIVQAAKERNMTKQQRLQGIPNGSISSLERYDNFNKY